MSTNAKFICHLTGPIIDYCILGLRTRVLYSLMEQK